MIYLIKFCFFGLLITIFHFDISYALDKCEWSSKIKSPCITVTKIPNSSFVNEKIINKIVIDKEKILTSGALDINDILKQVPGLDVFQSGQKGQTTSIFMRGSESNHTLVLLNGIPIMDQSVTDGLHDFGQDFIQNIQQIEIFKGANGAHFGSNAIAGAINLITDIDYQNTVSKKVSITNNILKNNSLDGNFSHITKNDWRLNFKGSLLQSETNSAIAKGHEYDGAKNYQINFNGVKWLEDNLKYKSTIYTRKTKSDYDGSSSDEVGYVSDNKMLAWQNEFEKRFNNSREKLTIHYHQYDRNYRNSGFLDEYKSDSIIIKTDKDIKLSEKSFGVGFDYKYDWVMFENRGSYSASTRGHVKNTGLFSNFGYKINDKKISAHFRNDYHNTTGKITL